MDKKYEGWTSDNVDADNGLSHRSGTVAIKEDRIASFLYDLMIDHLPTGTVEELVRKADASLGYTNGWLALYAQDLANRLRDVG